MLTDLPADVARRILSRRYFSKSAVPSLRLVSKDFKAYIDQSFYSFTVVVPDNLTTDGASAIVSTLEAMTALNELSVVGEQSCVPPHHTLDLFTSQRYEDAVCALISGIRNAVARRLQVLRLGKLFKLSRTGHEALVSMLSSIRQFEVSLQNLMFDTSKFRISSKHLTLLDFGCPRVLDLKGNCLDLGASVELLSEVFSAESKVISFSADFTLSSVTPSVLESLSELRVNARQSSLKQGDIAVITGNGNSKCLRRDRWHMTHAVRDCNAKSPLFRGVLESLLACLCACPDLLVLFLYCDFDELALSCTLPRKLRSFLTNLEMTELGEQHPALENLNFCGDSGRAMRSFSRLQSIKSLVLLDLFDCVGCVGIDDIAAINGLLKNGVNSIKRLGVPLPAVASDADERVLQTFFDRVAALSQLDYLRIRGLDNSRRFMRDGFVRAVTAASRRLVILECDSTTHDWTGLSVSVLCPRLAMCVLTGGRCAVAAIGGPKLTSVTMNAATWTKMSLDVAEDACSVTSVTVPEAGFGSPLSFVGSLLAKVSKLKCIRLQKCLNANFGEYCQFLKLLASADSSNVRRLDIAVRESSLSSQERLMEVIKLAARVKSLHCVVVHTSDVMLRMVRIDIVLLSHMSYFMVGPNMILLNRQLIDRIAVGATV